MLEVFQMDFNRQCCHSPNENRGGAGSTHTAGIQIPNGNFTCALQNNTESQTPHNALFPELNFLAQVFLPS